MACPHLELCGLHQSLAMQAGLRVWRSFYCDANHQRCERYKLVAGGVEVPPRLLPNGRLLDLPEGVRDREM